MHKFKSYLQLMRVDKPIGVYLLLWPTLMALFAASHGLPSIKLTVVYVLGVFVMRSAGCIINDIADRKFDCHVARTKDRPITSGQVSVKDALILLSALLLLALILVLQTNLLTFYLSLAALSLCLLYPFTKRFFACPQFILGVAFSWGIPMVYASTQESVPLDAWILFAGSLFYPLAYDTLYAMADKAEDLKIPICSSAILFGRYDKVMVLVFYGLTLFCWGIFGNRLSLQFYFPISLVLGAILIVWQYLKIDKQLPSTCMQAFRGSHLIGLIALIGMVADLLRATV